MAYLPVLNSQFSAKAKLIKTVGSAPHTFTIQIKDNKIVSVIKRCGIGTGDRRSNQFTTLIQNTLEKYKVRDAILNINICDIPISGYFNFCRKRGSFDQFILPNHRFTNDDVVKDCPTFDATIEKLRSNWIPFEERIPAFYTSCVPHKSKQAYFEYALTHPFCKGYIWGGTIHKFLGMSEDVVKQILEKNLGGMKAVPFEDHLKYKYNIYNDGYTLSDRRRLLLNTGAVLIMQDSSPYEEFYTHLLKAGVHYIPFKEPKDLEGIYKHLEANPEVSKRIIENNKKFVDEHLTYNSIMKYTADLINGLYS